MHAGDGHDLRAVLGIEVILVGLMCKVVREHVARVHHGVRGHIVVHNRDVQGDVLFSQDSLGFKSCAATNRSNFKALLISKRRAIEETILRKITIKELKVRKVPGSAYTFDGATIADNDKKNVKALRFKLSIKRNGEEGTSTVVVRVPSNGPRD